MDSNSIFYQMLKNYNPKIINNNCSIINEKIYSSYLHNDFKKNCYDEIIKNNCSNINEKRYLNNLNTSIPSEIPEKDDVCLFPKEDDKVVLTNNEELQCKICLENRINAATQCGHTFCLPCLRSLNNNSKLCPICKTEISKVTKLFI